MRWIFWLQVMTYLYLFIYHLYLILLKEPKNGVLRMICGCRSEEKNIFDGRKDIEDIEWKTINWFNWFRYTCECTIYQKRNKNWSDTRKVESHLYQLLGKIIKIVFMEIQEDTENFIDNPLPSQNGVVRPTENVHG